MTKIRLIIFSLLNIVCVICVNSQSARELACGPIIFNYAYEVDAYGNDEFLDEMVSISFYENKNEGTILMKHLNSGEESFLEVKKDDVFYDSKYVIFKSDGLRLFISREGIRIGSNPVNCCVILREIETDNFISFHIGEFSKDGLKDAITKESEIYIKQYNSMIDYVNYIVSDKYTGFYEAFNLEQDINPKN